jgi:histidine triad (HIT) family protein/ATP adenylyltransferase
MTRERVPFDLDAYEQRIRSAPCFICCLLAGDPAYEHERVYEDDAHIAFLDAYPTVRGKVLVAPKIHVEHVVRDLDEAAYLRLMAVVRRVALAVEQAVPSERTYLLSLGSQQGNAHIHWHVAALPPGTPYQQQQFNALTLEKGVLALSREEAATLGARIRSALEPGR